MLTETFASKALNTISTLAISAALLGSVLTTTGWAMEQERDDFASKARKYAATYGTNTITSSFNEGRNNFTYIPDENGHPFAVLKEGNRAEREAFISSYTRSLRLNNVATSINLADFTIKDQSKPFQGLIEEYLSFGTACSPLDKDLKEFIERYKKGSIILHSITKDENHEYMNTLFKYLDVDSVHRIFSYVILVNAYDSDPKNIALRLNKNNKLEMQIFDTELAFSDTIGKSIIFYLPFIDIPLSESTREIVLSWTPEEVSKAQKLGCADHFYLNQQNRIQDFQNYLRTFPQATPMDIMLFAFFKTTNAQYQDGHIGTQGTAYIKGINLTEMKKFNPKGFEDFGYFFKNGLQCCMRGYLAAVYDYNEAREGQEKSLSDFIEFIPTRDYFNLEKFSEYKSYVSEKFSFHIH